MFLVTPFGDNFNYNYFSAFKFSDYFWPNFGTFYACGKWTTRLFFIGLFLDNKWISFAVCLFINRSQIFLFLRHFHVMAQASVSPMPF